MKNKILNDWNSLVSNLFKKPFKGLIINYHSEIIDIQINPTNKIYHIGKFCSLSSGLSSITKSQLGKEVIGNMQANPFFIVEPSPWPILISFCFFGLLYNSCLVFHNYIGFSWMILINIITLAYGSLLWGKDIIAEGTYLGGHTLRLRNGLWLGYVLFLFTELMAFLGVFWAFFHSSLVPTIEIGGIWPPLGIQTIQPTDLPLLNTIILLASGATITYSHHALIAKNWKGSVNGLFSTIILGILFVICQFFEYTYATFSISDGIYGSTFFFATGLHGLHLIGGTFFLSMSLYRLYTLQFTNTHHVGYETTILLWHFLDIIWLFLYICFYYWGT